MAFGTPLSSVTGAAQLARRGQLTIAGEAPPASVRAKIALLASRAMGDAAAACDAMGTVAPTVPPVAPGTRQTTLSWTPEGPVDW